MKGPEKIEKIIITFGCVGVAKPLRTKGFSVQSYKSLSQILNPTGELQSPRCFVIRTTALGLRSAERTVAGIRSVWPLVDIVVWAPRSSADLVLGVMRAGAKDVVLEEDPEKVGETVARIVSGQKILSRVRSVDSKRGARFKFDQLVSRSEKMWDIFEQAQLIAPTDATVLILGETGTGKELLARSIHRRSQRDGRFVGLNCAAIPENLLDSELFGHIRGAFTGANSDKKGLFRYADGGTLLLDEIGNMPLSAQYHLLRVLQEKTIRPVGGHEEIPVDVRIIAATSRPLEEYQASGLFREDLFYRLDVMRIVIPSLRERQEDIVFLFSHFARKFANQYKLRFPEMTDDFLNTLQDFDWPGNVRQLENITERLLLSRPNQRLTAAHFKALVKPREFAPKTATKPTIQKKSELAIDVDKPFYEALREVTEHFEREYLKELLEKHDGRVGAAAKAAGFSRRTLLRKTIELGIDRKKLAKGSSKSGLAETGADRQVSGT